MVLAIVVSPGASQALQILPLVDDSDLDCNGARVGVVIQRSLGADVQTLWIIGNGSPNQTRQLFYVCSAGPCHQGCGFSTIGTITTNAAGRGFALNTFANPFPGNNMHWDICPGSGSCSPATNYFSGVFVSPFLNADASQSSPAANGDPNAQ